MLSEEREERAQCAVRQALLLLLLLLTVASLPPWLVLGLPRPGRCWDEHAVLNTKAAEKKLKEQLPALGTVQCRGEEVLHALTLLSAPSWELSLRAGLAARSPDRV